MAAYYNELDPYAAKWLRNLICAGHIAPGDVDERSIVDVRADDLRLYTQAHFFAGIGGWSYALRLAGWPDDKPVWTGSCPCQPFSVAGKGKAQGDDRHLWPHWFRLIAAVRPSVVFGEQVAGAIAHGWLDDAFDDLEREGYETGAAVLPACSVGAPHKRDRLWFVAHAKSERLGKKRRNSSGRTQRVACAGETPLNVADTDYARLQGRGCQELPECSSEQSIGPRSAFMANSESCGWLQGDANAGGTFEEQGKIQEWDGFANGCNASSDSNGESEEWSTEPRNQCDFWQFEPAVGRVANGIQARAHKLRAYGNAIVPQVAAEFIKAIGLI